MSLKQAKAKAEHAEQQKRAEALGDNDIGIAKHPVLAQAVITGVLASRADSRDLKIEQFSVTTFGKQLVEDTTLELNHGNRYGLIGQNGSGKTTILAAIAAREGLPIPESVDMWFLDKEAPPSELNAIDAVIEKAKTEYERLENLTMELMEDAEENMDLLDAIGEKLDKMDPHTFESRAAELLIGLGFTDRQASTGSSLYRKTKDMSGGWRMRVALAQALFVQPTLLILDEPTNHLDLGACVWLEEYLSRYPNTLLFVSHSIDFMDTVCTNIMQLTHNGKLKTWGGNYSTYVKTREELEKNQMTKWKKDMDDIKHLEEFIRSCGTFANLRKQADSKQKVVDKLRAELVEKPVPDPTYSFNFPDAEKLPPPVMAFSDVSFSYSGKKADYLYENLSFGVDLDSRIALVGPNGAGKSTLLKLMRDELFPCEGEIKRHAHLRIGQYNQHSEEVLDLSKSPLDFFAELYPDGIITTEGKKKMEIDAWRAYLGKFGITQDKQTRPMKSMSDGYRTRVVFAMISLTNPHILLLDEPTNHLDMQCIDSLANAINAYSGGLVLVSHDFRLIQQVAKEVWVCDDRTIKPWPDANIKTYKKHLRDEVMKSSRVASFAKR